jgi:translocation and assembly module TamB
MSRFRKFLWPAVSVALGVVTLLAAIAFFSLRSRWFRETLRQAVVREIERTTGGRAGIAEFSFDWKTLQADARNVVIHGTEPPGEAPFVSIEHARVGLGLKSFALNRIKVDVHLLTVDNARVNVIADAQGRTNLPSPPTVRDGRNAVEKFLSLAVGEYRVRRSEFRYLSRRLAIDVEGKDLDLALVFDRAANAYGGTLSTKAARIAAPFPTPARIDAQAAFRIGVGEVTITDSLLRKGQSNARFRGSLGTLDAPLLNGGIDGSIRLSDFRNGEPGAVDFTAKVAHQAGQSPRAEGRVNAQGLRYRRDGIELNGIAARGNWRTGGDGVELSGLEVGLLGGVFRGVARVRSERDFFAEGEIAGFPAGALARLRGIELPWSAMVNGRVALAPDSLSAQLDFEPAGGALPLSGNAGLDYHFATRRLTVGRATLNLPNSRIDATGRPDQQVDFGLFSRDLSDLTLGMRLLDTSVPEQLPVTLGPQGLARIEGRWTGGLVQPKLTGSAKIDSLVYQGRSFEHFESAFEAGPTHLSLTATKADDRGVTISGNLAASLSGWKLEDASRISGDFRLAGIGADALLKQAARDLPLRGVVSASAKIGGTLGSPHVDGSVSIANVRLADETFDSGEAKFRFANHKLEIADGQLRAGAGRMAFSVLYEIPAGPDQDAIVHFETRSAGFRLGHWNFMQERRLPIDGKLDWTARGSARQRGPLTRLTSLDGQVDIGDATVQGRPLGSARITSETLGRQVNARFDARVRDSKLTGSGDWNLDGTSRGLGQLQFSRITFASLRDLGLLGDPLRPLAFTGFLDAEVGFSGPILRPETWTAIAKVTTLEIQPNPRQAARAERIYTLRNREPLVAALDVNGAKLQAVHLVAEGTDLEATGSIGFHARNPFNLQLRGRLSLPVLSMFEPDLIASGVSTLDASVRGSFERPQLTGRMEIRDAAFNLRGLPNGLEKTNGVIVFDRTRANIERITAHTGGGDLAVSGFIGFGGDELIYGLNTSVQRVRVRYPAAVSTTFNSNLSLTGTSSRSLLAGTVIIDKVGIVPRTDIGTLLAEAGRASNAPLTAPNDFLRGMQLDLKINTSPDAELQSSLARDLEPEASFRLYGSIVKPTLIGRATVNQGEINFFGNQYTITRGDISFYNTAKVEPVLDFDLETRVRGVTVNINFTGPVNRLDVSYRSDPPLRSTEIVALLAVGRTPDSALTRTATQTANQGFLASTNNTLFGQAISAPISSRLERLFGVSRIKIDPELTGVTNIPQARLTVEQQLSRDVTVTYITNLNRTQQQIVRVQWDLNRDFSVLAVRDDNGVFGVDFQYRKRFK